MLLAFIAPSKMVFAMHLCRGTPSEHRMSVILPYEGSAIGKSNMEYLCIICQSQHFLKPESRLVKFLPSWQKVSFKTCQRGRRNSRLLKSIDVGHHLKMSMGVSMAISDPEFKLELVVFATFTCGRFHQHGSHSQLALSHWAAAHGNCNCSLTVSC